MQSNRTFLLLTTKQSLKLSNISLEHVAQVTLCGIYTKSRVDYVNSFILSPVNSTKKLTEVFYEYINLG
jgi:hypothetical protein